MFHFFEKKDSQLQQDVLNELMWDPSIDSEQITATAKNGIVTLRGSVPHYFEKSLAETAAQRVSGIRAVADELEVKLLGTYSCSDEDIAEAALSALKWNYSVPKDIKVVVEKGWVTLSGQVDWEYQRNAARMAVGSLYGVCGITNKIQLKSRVQSDDVKTRIEDALKRSAESEGQKIRVDVNGDKVTLSGNVHSLSELEEARMAAWNAPGVMTVENNIHIS